MDLDGDGRVNEAEYILAKLVEIHAVDPAEVELGSGRIVTSAKEVPNLLVNLV